MEEQETFAFAKAAPARGSGGGKRGKARKKAPSKAGEKPRGKAPAKPRRKAPSSRKSA